MIVTSFSQKGYHEYGRKFIESFLEHWNDEELTVYYERKLPRNHPEDNRLHYINLYDSPDYVHFEKMLKESDPIYRGLMRNPNAGKQEPKQAYNYRYDAYKFFRKVYAITHAASGMKDELLTWVDADVLIHEDIPENYTRSLLPQNDFLAYLGRPSVYTEAGFMIFDMSHIKAYDFMGLYWNTYATGAFKYLGEFHDCYVLDFVRTVMEIPSYNLCPKESDHPFINSPLGQYMDHMKGPTRKTAGRSDPKDLKVKHDTPYWDIPVESEAVI